jgi:hypothetical protein
MKQRINTKSSAEAELVGVSDAIGDALHIAQILQELKYSTVPIAHQDNQSTIELIHRGRPTTNSRHIDIKYFFVHDLVKRNAIIIQYTPTNEMVSDILTKPVQGKQFVYLRSRLMGHVHPIEGSVMNHEGSHDVPSAASTAALHEA